MQSDWSNSDFGLQADDGLLQALSTAILVCESNLCVAFTNVAAHSLLEISAAHLSGTNILGLFKQPDVEGVLKRCLNTQQATTLRRIEIVSFGRQQTKLVDCIVTPLQSDGASRLILEINEVNLAIRQLEADTMEIGQHANSAVIRAIAHEIKNPLGGLRGAAQLLNRQLTEHPKLKVYTDIIVRETDRLCGLVDSMSHPQKPVKLRPINIHEVLEHVSHLAQAEGADSFTIERDYDPSLPAVLADREQLIQAFMNMLRNAIEAIDESGRITFRTRVQRQVTLEKMAHMTVAQIDIEDNGRGIPAELIDQVFYPMISSKSQGEGLGLSIVHQIINRHGGTIRCNSQPGQTVFTIYLKFADGRH